MLPRSQVLSPLPPLVIGRKTLIAACHVTTCDTNISTSRAETIRIIFVDLNWTERKLIAGHCYMYINHTRVITPLNFSSPHAGHFESQENKKLCFCMSSLALDERLTVQNLVFEHCMIKVFWAAILVSCAWTCHASVAHACYTTLASYTNDTTVRASYEGLGTNVWCAVRQRSVRQETTMARAGTLPSYLYQREVWPGESVSLECSAEQRRNEAKEADEKDGILEYYSSSSKDLDDKSFSNNNDEVGNDVGGILVLRHEAAFLLIKLVWVSFVFSLQKVSRGKLSFLHILLYKSLQCNYSNQGHLTKFSTNLLNKK